MANVDPLVIGRVMGDVVDMFVPSVSMSVYYDSKRVTNGCDIKPSMAAQPPRVTITGYANQLYTLVMIDPDAPSPSEPIMREWVQWIVTDIPGCTSVARGREVLPYLGPTPRLGIHRYILVLFKQSVLMGDQLIPPPSRSNFNTRAFAQNLGLGIPVSTVYFNAHKEPANRKRHT